MESSLEAFLTGRWLSDLANFSAFVFHELPGLNWAGFYLDDGARLILGPFVGKPACTEIAYTRGVCGAAFTRREALLVPDVHDFPGHIACDSASRSEMVLPLLWRGECFGVFDLDSPGPNRFTDGDRERVERWLQTFFTKNAEHFSGGSPWRPPEVRGGQP